MSDTTAISWCDATFNPWWGCTKVSPACDYCYAERDAKRFAPGKVLWGVGSERRTFGDAHWQQPLKWAKRAFVECPACGWRGTHTQLRHDSGAHFCPSCGNDEWRLARMRVFCASMGDWLDLDAPLPEFVLLLDTIRRTPELDWLLLTKRIGNWRKRLDEAMDSIADEGPAFLGVAAFIELWRRGNAPDNVWLGATVVNQEEADRDVPKLLAVPARLRFLSIEPILGPIDLGKTLWQCCERWEYQDYGCYGHRPECCGTPVERDLLHWVIAGGESGPHARPSHPDWFRSLRDQCAAAGVPFHFKQWGEFMPPESATTPYPVNDWRDVLDATGTTRRVAFFGDAVLESSRQVVRVGKKAAGRLLDGVEHNGFPA